MVTVYRLLPMPLKNNSKPKVTRGKNAASVCYTCKQTDPPHDEEALNDNWLSCAVCKKKFHAFCERVLDSNYCDIVSSKFYFCLACVNQSNVNTTQTGIFTPAVTSKTADTTFTNEGVFDREAIAAEAHKKMQLFWPHIEQCIEKMVTRIIDDCMVSIRLDLVRSAEKMANLEKKMVEQENRARSHNIVIRGCPDRISIEPRDIVKRIAVLTDCQLADGEITSARRLFRSTNGKGIYSKNISNISSTPILATFSSIESKIIFLKKFFNMIKIKRIRVCNLIQDYSLDKNLSVCAESEIFVGDHLEKDALDCFIRVRRLQKNGVVNKFIIRRGHIWIAIKEGDIFTRVDTIAELQEKIGPTENNGVTRHSIDVSLSTTN